MMATEINLTMLTTTCSFSLFLLLLITYSYYFNDNSKIITSLLQCHHVINKLDLRFNTECDTRVKQILTFV